MAQPGYGRRHAVVLRTEATHALRQGATARIGPARRRDRARAEHLDAPGVGVDGVQHEGGDQPEVASLVLNPVNAHPGGVEVLGAEIVLAPAPRRADPGRRSLT